MLLGEALSTATNFVKKRHPRSERIKIMIARPPRVLDVVAVDTSAPAQKSSDVKAITPQTTELATMSASNQKVRVQNHGGRSRRVRCA